MKIIKIAFKELSNALEIAMKSDSKMAYQYAKMRETLNGCDNGIERYQKEINNKANDFSCFYNI